jgi:hypothetical protein
MSEDRRWEGDQSPEERVLFQLLFKTASYSVARAVPT